MKHTEVKVQLMEVLISSVVIIMLFMCQWIRLVNQYKGNMSELLFGVISGVVIRL